MTTLVWFRDDLRTTDNAALAWAAARGDVVGIVVDESVGRPLGAAARWWRNESIAHLSTKVPLIRAQGDPRPACRLSTPACASCGPPAPCTTAHAW